jgi:hypothetical protein
VADEAFLKKVHKKFKKFSCFPFTEIDPDLGPLITEIKTHDFIYVISRLFDNTQVCLENSRFFRFFIWVRGP